MVTWVDVGRGCYRVVSEHGSTLGVDGKCVDHAFMLVSYVFSMLVVYVCLFHFHGVGRGCNNFAM